MEQSLFSTSLWAGDGAGLVYVSFSFFSFFFFLSLNKQRWLDPNYRLVRVLVLFTSANCHLVHHIFGTGTCFCRDSSNHSSLSWALMVLSAWDRDPAVTQPGSLSKPACHDLLWHFPCFLGFFFCTGDISTAYQILSMCFTVIFSSKVSDSTSKKDCSSQVCVILMKIDAENLYKIYCSKNFFGNC